MAHGEKVEKKYSCYCLLLLMDLHFTVLCIMCAIAASGEP
jgi:hypothetical protein